MNIVHTKRAVRGSVADIAEAVVDRYAAGEPLSQAVADSVADKIAQRFEVKIRNGFSAAGVELPEGPLTADVLKDVIAERTGLELESMSPADVVRAVDAELSRRLSERLGVPVPTVLDAAALVQSLKDYIAEELRSGRGAALLSRAALKAARRMKALREAQSEEEELRRARNRLYQKRYRATHREVWE